MMEKMVRVMMVPRRERERGGEAFIGDNGLMLLVFFTRHMPCRLCIEIIKGQRRSSLKEKTIAMLTAECPRRWIVKEHSIWLDNFLFFV
jgi:hypothetical protein